MAPTALAVLVDRPGDEFLAGAALALNQDGDILRGDSANGLEHALHGLALAEHHVAVVALATSGVTATGMLIRRRISAARVTWSSTCSFSSGLSR